MADIYRDIHSSLLKYCKDFVAANYSSTGFQIFDFDAHGSVNDLPAVPLIGVAEYALTDNVSLYEGECSIIVATQQDDYNLKLLRPVISKLFDALKANSHINVIRSSDGQIIGRLVLKEGVSVSPVARTKTRPLQAINLMFGSSFLVPP